MVVHVVEVVQEVIVSCDRSDIAAKLEFVSQYVDFCFRFIDFRVEEFGLSSFRVSVLFCLPDSPDTLLDKVLS